MIKREKTANHFLFILYCYKTFKVKDRVSVKFKKKIAIELEPQLVFKSFLNFGQSQTLVGLIKFFLSRKSA